MKVVERPKRYRSIPLSDKAEKCRNGRSSTGIRRGLVNESCSSRKIFLHKAVESSEILSHNPGMQASPLSPNEANLSELRREKMNLWNPGRIKLMMKCYIKFHQHLCSDSSSKSENIQFKSSKSVRTSSKSFWSETLIRERDVPVCCGFLSVCVSIYRSLLALETGRLHRRISRQPLDTFHSHSQ